MNGGRPRFDPAQLAVPIVQAPMAGGPSTPGLAAAVGQAGGLGFLAAGYLTAAELAARLDALRARTAAPFGVNLFVPQPPPPVPSLSPYRRELAGEAERYGVALPEPDPADDDHWAAKLALLTSHPVPVVSFTFDLPPAAAVEQLRGVGAYLVATVTSVAAARAAAGAGMDALCVQGPEAGGHRGHHDPYAEPDPTPLLELVPAVAAEVGLPIIAAGGLMTGADLAAALRAGARAVQLGTAYLRTPESGANQVYRQALADDRFNETVVTRAFSGRLARGLRNRFTDAHHATAPVGYPLVNQLTKPLRAAAAAQGDPDGLSLWAGTGHRLATGEPAAPLTLRLWREALAAR